MNAVRKDLRHRARESALQILYAWDVGHADIEQAIDFFFTHQWAGAERPPEDLRQFAAGLARETVGRLSAIDPLIADTTERWRPERMAVLDRLILRMAVCEMLLDSGTPAAVIINEALELARTFSTEDAVKFINGMLDGVRKKLEQESR